MKKWRDGYRSSILWMFGAGLLTAIVGGVYDMRSTGDDLTLAVYVFGLGLMVTAINQMVSTARSDEQHEYEVNRDKGLKELLTEIRDRM